MLRRRLILCLILAAAMGAIRLPGAQAHAVIENSMRVVVRSEAVSIHARVFLPEVDIANSIDDDGIGLVPKEKLDAAVRAHGAYLLSHLRISADGRPLAGRVQSIEPPAGDVTWERFEECSAEYELSYPIPGKHRRPGRITIDQDLLKEFTHLGQAWVVTFSVQIRQEDQPAFTQALLAPQMPVTFDCTWPPATTTPMGPTAPVPAGRTALSIWRVGGQYALHGLHHILSGYDHLLFVAALVLAAGSLWDLVRVVTAFALAHTLTLTLSVLNLLRLPPSVVEPVIAASIVFVALQNALFPQQARGVSRLVVAFIFGLFHGLGFAGGLLGAMEGLPASNLAVALVAFTLGVEAAHQLLIVPLFLLLQWLRKRGGIAPAVADLPRLPLSRLASLAVSAIGCFYLLAALRGW